MTQLIESTSSAPTLRELAVREFEKSEQAHAAERTQAIRKAIANAESVLAIMLRDTFGVTDADIVTHVPEDGSPFDTRAHDGLSDLWFSVRRNLAGDKNRVHVLVPCDHGCGKELWVEVDSLYSLGYALESEQVHFGFNCLVQYGDDGEPTTDRFGNPLPAPQPPKPSALERSKLAIAAITDAADTLAGALNTVAELEDARTFAKVDAIARLIATGVATSPSAAEKIVEKDDGYMAHRALQRTAELARHRAIAGYDAAVLTARLAVEIFTAEERNR